MKNVRRHLSRETAGLLKQLIFSGANVQAFQENAHEMVDALRQAAKEIDELVEPEVEELQAVDE